jgi:hypothetical protein
VCNFAILALMLWETISSADYPTVLLSQHGLRTHSGQTRYSDDVERPDAKSAHNPKPTSPVAPLSLIPPNAVIKNAVIRAKLLANGKIGPEQVQQGLSTELLTRSPRWHGLALSAG